MAKKKLAGSFCKRVILKSLRSLSKSGGTDIFKLGKCIKKFYKSKTSFPLRKVLDWMVGKGILERKNNRVWIKKNKKHVADSRSFHGNHFSNHRSSIPWLSQGAMKKGKIRSSPKAVNGKKLKFRDMILKAIKVKGKASYDCIEKFLVKHYKVKNVFVVKQTLKWLESKGVLKKRNGLYSLTGKPLTLYSSLPAAQASGKKKLKRKRRKRRH